MKLTVSFKHMETSDSLREYVTEKCEKLQKYFHGKISVHWTLSHEKLDKIAHCHLVGNSMDFFGEDTTGDFRASIENTLEKIEKQIQRKKEIVKDHLHKHAHDEDAEKELAEGES